MAYLKLAVIIGALIGIVKAIIWFNGRCDRRFGYTFFTLRAFCQEALGINFMWAETTSWWPPCASTRPFQAH